MKSKKLRLVVLVIIIIGAAGGAWHYKKRMNTESDFREVAVERGSITVSVLATGIVQPENRLEVKPPIPGRAEQVLVKEGDAVKKGQTVVWMSSTERAALLDAARARGKEELQKWAELYRPAPILAPVNGTIILKNIEPGQTFTASDSILVMSNRLTVQAQVDETDIGEISVGQAAQIVLDAYPKDKVTGRVEKVAFEAKTVNNVTTYIATILPQAVPDFMRSGMTANVTFKVSSKENVLVIPADAIKSRNNQKTVTISVPNSKKTEEREIVTGTTDGKRVEVTQGLSEGELLQVPKLSSLMRSRTPGANPFGGGMGGGTGRGRGNR